MNPRPAKRQLAWAAAVALGLGGVFAWTLDLGAAAGPLANRSTVAQGSEPSPFGAGAANAGAVAPTPQIGPAPSLLADVGKVERLLARGSLRGTALDGDWGLWVGEHLQPSLSLRRRFDYLLSGLGEAASQDLRAWIERAVRKEKGAAAVPQVLAIWDRYIELQKTPAAAPSRAPGSLAAALAERARVRRQILGQPWAEAFFAEEERLANAALAQRDGPAATPETAIDPALAALLTPDTRAMTPGQLETLQAQRVAEFGPEGASRLLAEDAYWAEWETRIAKARDHLKTIALSAELSTRQRSEAAEAWISEQFTGTDRVRAMSLLSERSGL